MKKKYELNSVNKKFNLFVRYVRSTFKLKFIKHRVLKCFAIIITS